MDAVNDSIPKEEFVKLMVTLKIASGMEESHDDHLHSRRKRDLTNVIDQSLIHRRSKRATTSAQVYRDTLILALAELKISTLHDCISFSYIFI